MQPFDVVIVGGGIMGCSTAYHLALLDPTLRIGVIEKDPTYRRASTALSVGNVRVQFSLDRNIQISMYTLEVLRRFADEMEVDGVRPDVSFKVEGNLFVIDEAGEARARRELSLQQSLGCRVEWWTAAEVERRFPLLKLDRWVGAAYGLDAGHLDGYSFLMGYLRKAAHLGVTMLTGEVVRVLSVCRRVAGVELAAGDRLECRVVVDCAGAWAADVAQTVDISLPVRPVQRQVFVVEPPTKPLGPLPLVVLPSGLYFRSEGEERLLVGRSLPEDRIGYDFQWSENRFVDRLWPELVTVVPKLDRLRLERGWTGLYAVNTFDGNAILGPWPELEGFFVACGFSGHGLQQAPAVGRYLAELVLERQPALDLSSFGPQRLFEGRRLEEAEVV